MKSLNKIILIGIAILSVLFLSFESGYCQNNKYAYKSFKPFKMAFISDIHLSLTRNDDKVLYKESLVITQDVIRSVNKTKDIDFIIFGGDLIDNQDHEFTDLPMLLDILSELKSPYYAIAGDRDMDFSKNYSQWDFLDEFNRKDISGNRQSYWTIEPVKDVLVIGLDTTIKNTASGKITEEQLNWLDKTLNDNKDKFTIITMHHPAIPVMNSAQKYIWSEFLIKNPEDFVKIIQKYPQVKLVINGHSHINYAKEVNNTVFLSSPSIVAYPNQYPLITVYKDKIIINNKSISFKQMIKKSKRAFGVDVNQAKLQKGDKNMQFKI